MLHQSSRMAVVPWSNVYNCNNNITSATPPPTPSHSAHMYPRLSDECCDVENMMSQGLIYLPSNWVNITTVTIPKKRVGEHLNS